VRYDEQKFNKSAHVEHGLEELGGSGDSHRPKFEYV
jgi:hypothetical protein